MKNKKQLITSFIIFTFIIFTSINVFAASCNEVISTELIGTLNEYFFDPVKIIGPVIFVLLTSFDFAKAVFANEKDGMEKAKKNVLRRAIALLLLFFAKEIIGFIVSYVNEFSIDACLNQIK